MLRALGCVALWLVCSAFDWPGRMQQLGYEAGHGDPTQRRAAVQQLASYPTDTAWTTPS